jgi:hypothetical protein
MAMHILASLACSYACHCGDVEPIFSESIHLAKLILRYTITPRMPALARLSQVLIVKIMSTISELHTFTFISLQIYRK